MNDQPDNPVVSTGTLTGIAIRSGSRAAMHELQAVALSLPFGVTGDARGRPGRRQVTVMSRQAWDAACEDLGADLPWTTRRCNLLVSGIDFAETSGARLVLGNAILEITGETEPCDRMDEQYPGLRTALLPDWRAGACCRVLEEGPIEVGMTVRMETHG